MQRRSVLKMLGASALLSCPFYAASAQASSKKRPFGLSG
jgi:hypothetical protein